MQITINNTATRLVLTAPTVMDVLLHLHKNPQRVMVELNGQWLAKERYPSIQLHDNDQLEIVHFVGGG